MPIECKLIEATSKQGVKYVCLEITLTDKVKKKVFLTQAEMELIRMYYKK